MPNGHSLKIKSHKLLCFRLHRSNTLCWIVKVFRPVWHLLNFSWPLNLTRPLEILNHLFDNSSFVALASFLLSMRYEPKLPVLIGPGSHIDDSVYEDQTSDTGDQIITISAVDQSSVFQAKIAKWPHLLCGVCKSLIWLSFSFA